MWWAVGYRLFSSSSGRILESLDDVCVSLGPLESPCAEGVLECSSPSLFAGGEVEDAAVDLGRVDLDVAEECVPLRIVLVSSPRSASGS